MSDKRDIVIHQFSRGPRAPSFGPFVIKLETFVRMAGRPYTNCFGRKMSPKGKIPWMTLNGKVISDSEFCIDELKARLGVNLNKNLTPEQRGVARAFQKMAEENLYWCMVLCRWVYADELKDWLCKFIGFSKLFFWYLRRLIRKQTHAQGVGRHSYDEILTIMESDLKALSDFLGTKKFLMGDEPCEADAAIFGQLSQFRWHVPGNVCEQLVKEKYSNLGNYCETMKAAFWPDWEECITDDGKREATK